MADDLPFMGETEDEQLARLSLMVDEYGDDILTDEEAGQLGIGAPLQVQTTDHYANLAEHVSDSQLAHIAQNVIEWAERDEEARSGWYKREKRGMVLLGLLEDDKTVAPFKGATTATHPLMAEACTNFQARAIAELWPAGGPVKTIVLGHKTPQLEAQSMRVRGFMNYQYTSVNGGFDEEDRMLMRLPMSGSCFKKQYFDPHTGIVRSDFVEPADFLVPYQASSLRTAIRFTHRMRNVTGNDLKKLTRSGYYRDYNTYIQPIGEGMDNNEVHDAIDKIEGREPVDYEENAGYTLLECHCYLDLEGFEDVDEAGQPTGIALPYVVTVEEENQLVLSIRRGWKKEDIEKTRRLQFTHYKFLPGFGFYGFGFVHVIGGLSQAATGALRAYLDAAGLANMKGGFKSRDAKLKTDEPLGMGEWREADMTAEELAKCFYPMEYREPSKGLFEMLGYLDSVGRRYTSTTENLVGDANNNGPVGTTLALIEQGLKVFSGIHKRLHEAHAEEFRIMADLYSEYLPQTYPYLIEGEEATVFQADFDARIDVIPVSDPNTVSNTQRIAQGQAVVELSANAPQIYDIREVHYRMLSAMQVPDIEKLLPPPNEVEPMDPITEGARMLTGQAVQAFPDQDHLAHMATHQKWWEEMVPVDLQKDLEPVYKAHQAEHLAEWYKIQMLQQMGMPPEALQDPQLAGVVAQQAAMVVQLMAPESLGIEQAEQQQPGEDPMVAAADIQTKQMQAEADIARKDAVALADIERKDAQAQAEIDRAAKRDIMDAAREAAKAEAELDVIEKGSDQPNA